ncbi:MAG: tetratricopeptide repeat protein [Cyclobacteriaceae bacterium]
MDTWYFWRSWHAQSRGCFIFLLALFGFLLFYFTYHYFQSPEAVIEWQKISNIDKLSLPAETFRVGLFDFTYSLDNYAITESFRATAIQPSLSAAYLHLGVLALAFIIFSTVISALRGFWFYFGILIISGFFISLRLEQLMLFGSYDKTGLLIMLSLYLPLLYYFAYLRTDHALLIRIISFSVLTLLSGALLYFTSNVPYPLYYLAHYSLPAALVLSVVFIFLLGHTMISFFLKIVTMGNTVSSRHSTWHFLAVSVIYLLNVFLLFLYNTGRISWDILYLNAFFILGVVALLGLWDFKDREVQYRSAFAFAPLGAFFYMALALITFSTLAYIFLTANDPLMEAMEDTIIYSQIGYGLIFMFYVIGNFIQPLMDNQQVYRIMYKPPTFPYGTAQITGFIATLAFFLNANLFPFYQTIAGYYNGLGDTYLMADDRFLAEQYYKMGDQYGYNNHRSNYALGSLARAQEDEQLAQFYFSEALKKRPTPYAQVNLGYELQENERLFDALFSFRQGLEKFPDNPYLYNNLAITFGKTSVLDSALYYLKEAGEDPRSREAAETNILGLIAKNENLLTFDLDSLISEAESGDAYLPASVNQLLLLNKYRPQATARAYEWRVPADSVLSSFDFAYLYNYVFNKPEQLDSTQLRVLREIAENPANGSFYEALLLINAYAMYANNQVVDAMKTLDYLQALNPFQRGNYNNILGLWALQMNAPEVASAYLDKAVAARYEDALFRYAVSKAEAMALPGGNQREAYLAWDSLARLEKEGIREVQQVVSDMLSITSGNVSQLNEQEDSFIYQYLRYRAPFMSESELESALSALDDPAFLVLALHDLHLRFPSWQSEVLNKQSEAFLQQKLSLSESANLYRDWLRVYRLENQGKTLQAAELAKDLQEPSRWHELKKMYLQAVFSAENAEPEVAKELAARMLGNPFYEQGFLFAVDYLYADDPLRQYELILDAVETHPFNPALKKAYIRSSLQQGLESYAEGALEELRSLLPAAEFAEYLQTYEALKAEMMLSF